MWIYDKKLQFPVRIKNPNANYAKIIISQLGGPDGELAASMRYLHQRYSMPYDKVRGILTDVGTEELAHLEMIAAILYQLTEGLSPEEIKKAGMDIKRSKICGGGAKSLVWRRIIANVLNVELETLACEEGPALGAAMLAAVGCGEYRTVEDAVRAIVRVTDVVEPENDFVQKYEERYGEYQKLYPAIKSLY